MRPAPLFCICFLIACCGAGVSEAQRRASVWFFGDRAGVDFRSGSPVDLDSSYMTAPEGCASLCDEQGKLLFYTSGTIVVDRMHLPMPNGFGLNGDPSTTQSGLVVPVPFDSNRYYIFTLDLQGGPKGLQYSMVDMRLNNGRGDVEKGRKNIFVRNGLNEKLTATIHADRHSYWVVTHGNGDNVFYAYRITRTGLDTVPVISRVGAPHPASIYGTIGYMKISPNAKRLACAITGANFLEVFDFDNSTGRVSAPIKMLVRVGQYGVEFSPNSKMLYIAYDTHGTLIQFDLDQPDANSIRNSIYTVDSLAGAGALQLGPDQKIYVNSLSRANLGVINNPDGRGAYCDYKPKAVPLSHNCRFGLPNYIGALLLPRPRIVVENGCLGDTTHFSAQWDLEKRPADSIAWYFGDASGRGPASFSATHQYRDTGTYTVHFVYTVDGLADTVEKLLTIYKPPPYFLPPDTTVCYGDGALLKAPPGASQVYWWDGASDSEKFVTLPYTYTVTAWYGHCMVQDSMTLATYAPNSAELGPADTIMCDVKYYWLLADSVPGYTWRWHNGSASRVYRVSESEKVWLEQTNGHCTYSDTQNVVILRPPWFNFGSDTMLCPGASFTLVVNNPYSEVRWSDGSIKKSFEINKAGNYEVTVSNKCGVYKEQIRVGEYPQMGLDLGPDITLCEGNAALLADRADSLGYTYSWGQGATAAQIQADRDGQYILTKTGPCGSLTDTLDLIYKLCECPMYIPNTFSPNNDRLNEKWLPQSCSLHDYYLEIYNRWGERLYTTTDPAAGWDGQFKGATVQEGMYIYLLSATSQLGERLYRKGNIYIIR